MCAAEEGGAESKSSAVQNLETASGMGDAPLPENTEMSHDDMAASSSGAIAVPEIHSPDPLSDDTEEFVDGGRIAAAAVESLAGWRAMKKAISDLAKEERRAEESGLSKGGHLPWTAGSRHSFMHLSKTVLEPSRGEEETASSFRGGRLQLQSLEAFLRGLDGKTSAELTPICLERARWAFDSHQDSIILWLGHLQRRLKEPVHCPIHCPTILVAISLARHYSYFQDCSLTS